MAALDLGLAALDALEIVRLVRDCGNSTPFSVLCDETVKERSARS
jgi:hypothetical protein